MLRAARSSFSARFSAPSLVDRPMPMDCPLYRRLTPKSRLRRPFGNSQQLVFFQCQLIDVTRQDTTAGHLVHRPYGESWSISGSNGFTAEQYVFCTARESLRYGGLNRSKFP